MIWTSSAILGQQEAGLRLIDVHQLVDERGELVHVVVEHDGAMADGCAP